MRIWRIDMSHSIGERQTDQLYKQYYVADDADLVQAFVTRVLPQILLCQLNNLDNPDVRLHCHVDETCYSWGICERYFLSSMATYR